MDPGEHRSLVLRPRGPEEVTSATKKSLLVGLVLFVVGAVLGVLLSGDVRGLLAGATGLLPAVSGLGAAHRDDRELVESVGTVREGLDSSTERVERSIEHLESAQRGLRESVDALRGAAQPIGPPNSSSNSDISGGYYPVDHS